MKGVQIVTDLHLRSENTDTQPNLLEDQQKILDSILEIAEQGVAKYDEFYVVLAGDVVDRDLKDPYYTTFCLFFEKLKSIVTELYCVIGNHETTHKLKNNIFWRLVYGGDINKFNKFPHICDTLHVVNDFRVDNCIIKLWHHGCEWESLPLKDNEDLVVIGHNNVMVPGMKETYATMSVDLQEQFVHYRNLYSTIRNPENLRYLALGHQHSLVGKFVINEKIGPKDCKFILEHLGSLGLTKHNEFGIQPKRNVPIVEIDGNFVRVTNHLVAVPEVDRLNFAEIEASHDKYEKYKHIKELKTVQFSEDDLVSDLQQLFSVDSEKRELFNRAIHEDPDPNIALAMTRLARSSVYV